MDYLNIYGIFAALFLGMAISNLITKHFKDNTIKNNLKNINKLMNVINNYEQINKERMEQIVKLNEVISLKEETIASLNEVISFKDETISFKDKEIKKLKDQLKKAKNKKEKSEGEWLCNGNVDIGRIDESQSWGMF